MIKFDPTKLSIEIVQLKRISTALGGSISVIDHTRTTSNKEVLKRVDVPMSVARSFIHRHKKLTKYLKPVYTAIVRYDHHIVALERHPLGSFGQLVEEGVFGEKEWTPQCRENIDKIVIPLTLYSGARQWYFDGRYVYSFLHNDPHSAVINGERMSSSGSFRKVNATAIDLQELHAKSETVRAVDRTCIGFIASNSTFAISPPIWKDAGEIGARQQKKGKDDDADGDMMLTVNTIGVDAVNDNGNVRMAISVENQKITQFDEIDQHLAVSLNFALKAGKDVGHLFGYEAVEPLHLPRLMVELHTVNLPNVPKEVKATYDIGMPYTHAVAWLLGLLNRTNTLDSYLVVRQLLKYLCSKGIFRKDVLDANRVFRSGVTIDQVPHLDVKALMEETTSYAKIAELVEKVTKKGKKKRNTNTDFSSVGTLMNEGD